MKKIYLYYFLLTLIVVHCSQEPEPVPAGIATLIAPANNEACLDGTPVSDTQSSVDFQWNAATNAMNYKLIVTNLLTNQTQNFSSVTPNLQVTLVHQTPYQWQVEAMGEPETLPTSSESWKFYLAAEAQTNYAPFPPQLLLPESAATVTPINGLINLSWSASDLDNDIERFEIYLDTNDGSTKLKDQSYAGETTTIEVDVESNQIYYWKIVAIDSSGNRSDSGIYNFRTQ